jgi:hypothetical protein
MSGGHMWVDPEMLRVEWLEHSMLVHAITLSEPPRSPWVHPLFAGAVVTGVAGAAAATAGFALVAGALGVGWAGCVGGLGSIAWRVAHAAPPVRRRLLIELKPEQISWTVLDGDRWSMRHQHEVPLPTMSEARPVAGPHGAEVELTLHDGSRRTIPLHGLPARDADWLADRIGEGIEAASDALLQESSDLG